MLNIIVIIEPAAINRALVDYFHLGNNISYLLPDDTRVFRSQDRCGEKFQRKNATYAFEISLDPPGRSMIYVFTPDTIRLN